MVEHGGEDKVSTVCCSELTNTRTPPGDTVVGALETTSIRAFDYLTRLVGAGKGAGTVDLRLDLT
jgi:hypothetical protein